MSKAEVSVKDCRYPWIWYLVGVEGDVRCCCFSSSPVGNIHTSDPKEIWNNLTMQSLRATLKNNTVHTICRGAACKYVEAMKILGKTGEAAEAPNSELKQAPADFDEKWYVSQYFDVAAGIKTGRWKSGLEHFRRFGHQEFRRRSAQDKPRPLSSAEVAKTDPFEFSQFEAELRLSAFDNDHLSFTSRNLGTSTWQGGTETPSTAPIRGGARLYRSLSEIDNSGPLGEFRSALPRSVRQGEQVLLTIRVDFDVLPDGSSYLVVDMVREQRFWFARYATTPLIIGIEKTATTGQLRYFSSDSKSDKATVISAPDISKPSGTAAHV